MDTLAPLVLLTPLAGFLVNALLGRLLPRRIVGWIGAGSIGLAFVFALLALSQVLGGQRLDQTYFTWWQSADFNVPFNLYLDQLSTLMILVITGVGFLIHVYSIGYMREDPGYSRFFAYMNLFVFAMLLLVLSGNLLWLIIGWAGVGLSSYLLIGFWFERTSAVLAARKAFVMNTIGDVGMVFAAFLIFLNLRVLDFQGLFSRVHQLPKGGGVITAICLLLLVGAVAKSAQLPLHTWLPDAMEGPTPVSALIHAATMVTAGVYLVARMHLLYDWAPAAAATVAVIGGVTALFAATIGTSQVDIKRILAYSTMSQIGYMFLAVGIGAYAAGMFHFMTHAFFKALLFMAAGNVIHAFHDDQDIRHMGNLRAGLPITFWTFLIGTLSISGFPLLAGFFSKDEIIRAALSAPGSEFWLGVIALITAGLTAYYMFRLFFIAFGWEWLSHDDRHLHEALPVQTVPIIILAVGAVVGGYVPVASFLSPVFGHGVEVGTGAFIGLAALSVLAALIGFLTAYLLHARRPDLAVVWRTRLGPIHTLVEHKYYLDELYDRVFVRPGLALARFLNDIVEPRVIDGAVNGVADFFLLEAREFRLIQTGRVGTYALWTLGGAIGVVLVVAAFLGYLPVRLGG
ncbi:MAG: NADH-quinone oxidoreductase subunit [Chloroflexota bacterium]|jgi:NADH-quinone oxidoreductase subunit L|nr:NADH-quinone oxidoreductase subunit [Chloroflexota bacterium]